MNKHFYFLVFLLFFCVGASAKHVPEFSVAGFYPLKDTGREVASMNVAWRFHRGDVKEAYLQQFDDSSWQMVSLPHGIELSPIETSGCVNYQGIVWYRKHFEARPEWQNRKLFLHFEAIMGKCKIWLNGQLVKEHFGGYLPIIVDVSETVKFGEENLIAVCADNRDDGMYPPGKNQDVLDFTYAGGIYRDCWMISHAKTFITDANQVDVVAGGGIFFTYEKVTKEEATVCVKTHLRNEMKKNFSGWVEYEFVAPDSKKVVKKTSVRLSPQSSKTIATKVLLREPHLWTPETPSLYEVYVRVKNHKGEVVDGFRQKIGVRSLRFDTQHGFVLNGAPYGKALMGGNRHQDFAVIGNAMPNNLQWRDAYKLKRAGFDIVRLCHYTQDAAFLDACDELGIFTIAPTPGWQFWNRDPLFNERVESDIRQMVRRDRNHPSLIFWEPILNETQVCGDAAYDENVQNRGHVLVHEEFPNPNGHAAGGTGDLFTVRYDGQIGDAKVNFTREYGDGGSVNDWHGQNAPNRVARNWGEAPMLVQAQSYARSADELHERFDETPRYMGGAVWHSFDTQRGYHPDPFYGGIMDGFRQPKYAYYMYMSQRDARVVSDKYPSGPMVYIAHDMTPMSPVDVTVYSNCDSVRLTVYEGGRQITLSKQDTKHHLPSPILVFKDVCHYVEWQHLSYTGQIHKAYLLAEGFLDGKVVATHRVDPANRAERLMLTLDCEGVDLVADGSDVVTVVASMVDGMGHVKRLNNQYVQFEIEGEGRLLANPETFTNPRPIIWGDAPVLVQSTTRAGKIRVKAHLCFEGLRTPLAGELTFESVPPTTPLVYREEDLAHLNETHQGLSPQRKKQGDKQLQSLEEVYEQQNLFLQK